MPGWFSLDRFLGSEIPRGPAEAAPSHPEPDAVRRALSVVGTGRYHLGRGGRRPGNSTPLDAAGESDCSGLVSWALGLDRYQPGRIGGDWISTASMVRDAMGPRQMFAPVALADAVPGDVVTYKATIGVGHCGVIVAVNGPTWRELDIVDCAARKPPAIAHRADGGDLWRRKGGIVVRLVSA